MGPETGILGLIILVLDIWAIVKTIGSSASTGSKVLWVLVILLLPGPDPLVLLRPERRGGLT